MSETAPESAPKESEAPAESATKKGSSKEVLFQHPVWKGQVLIVPADKVDEYKEAGYERVKRDDEAELRETAVPIATQHRTHFGPSIVP